MRWPEEIVDSHIRFQQLGNQGSAGLKQSRTACFSPKHTVANVRDFIENIEQPNKQTTASKKTGTPPWRKMTTFKNQPFSQSSRIKFTQFDNRHKVIFPYIPISKTDTTGCFINSFYQSFRREITTIFSLKNRRKQQGLNRPQRWLPVESDLQKPKHPLKLNPTP